MALYIIDISETLIFATRNWDADVKRQWKQPWVFFESIITVLDTIRDEGHDIVLIGSSSSPLFDREQPMGSIELFAEVCRLTKLPAATPFYYDHDDIAPLPNDALLREVMRAEDANPYHTVFVSNNVEHNHAGLILDLPCLNIPELIDRFAAKMASSDTGSGSIPHL